MPATATRSLALRTRLAQALPRPLPVPSCCPAAPTKSPPSCAAARASDGVSIVPQGGNTGLVGGGVPDDSRRQVVLSTRRLRAVRRIDADNQTITVEAGLRAAGGAGRGRRGRPAVPAEPGRRRQLHHRRQPRDQRRRHAGAALRQRARAVPRARGGDRAGRALEQPARPAQGQHRLRPARPVRRQRRHAGHHHGRHAAPVPAAARRRHGAGRPAARWPTRWR